ncbi:LysR family transcriptional regulator [Salinicola peritrichatus]|uniref:LysR family transcriptional regulator n=1 Tax=Salinicola peritrichatus TaxID=1267424 RepID=UPI000DA15C8F|nr:LysR family transcriptional regulator [Salinicola peritrichatus]
MEDMDHYAALINRLRYKHLSMISLLDRHRNLHQAAGALNMSQPAATRMLREIETTFECQLFERTPRGLTPTPLGEVLIGFADNALTRLDRFAEELHRHRSGDHGQLVVGAIMGAAPDLVADAVIAMKRDRPRLRLRLMGETSDQLVSLLAHNRIDLAIARFATAMEHNLFDFEPLGNETMMAVVRREHPLAGDRDLSLEPLLEAWPWILQPLATPARQLLEKELELHGLVSPRDVVECGSIFAALQLVQRSDAILVMSESVLRDYLAFDILTPLSVSIGQTLAPFGLLTRKNETLNEPARHFCEILRQAAMLKR